MRTGTGPSDASRVASMTDQESLETFTEWLKSQTHWQDRVADFASDAANDPDWPWPRRYGGRETWRSIEEYLTRAQAADEVLDAAAEAWRRWLSELGGPRCDNCGRVATYAHLPYPNCDQLILSCDSEGCEDRPYYVSLADWYGDNARWRAHLRGKTWGPDALVLLDARLGSSAS
jgi:hypothetical protein